jgi:asparaginyl-tRNA synthetase
MRVKIKRIYESPGEFLGANISVCGWAKTVRDSKTVGFIELNDGSCFRGVQVVFGESLDNFEQLRKLGAGTCLKIEGALKETPEAKQPFEIAADKVLVLGDSPADYPLQKKRHGYEFLRTISHLRPRTNTFSAVFRVRGLAAYAIHSFFNERGFVYVHTPILTGSDCEGAGEMFQVTTLPLDKLAGPPDYGRDFFGKRMSLTVSGQLAVEPFCLAFGDVYTFGPTFRAENSNTPKHAAEFWMIEPELAFADLADNMRCIEDMLKYCVKYLMENAREELEFFNKFVDGTLAARLENVVSSDFARITYTEAVDMLKNSGADFEYPVSWGMDLQTEHERYLAETAFKRPVFVTDYPKGIKAFYMRRNDDGKTVAAVDLLAPGVGEIVGGSQREERLDTLIQALRENGLNEDEYRWYTDLRRFGGAPHSGFGLGFERFIMYVTGIPNIRDVIPYPRTAGKAEF